MQWQMQVIGQQSRTHVQGPEWLEVEKKVATRGGEGGGSIDTQGPVARQHGQGPKKGDRSTHLYTFVPIKHT